MTVLVKATLDPTGVLVKDKGASLERIGQAQGLIPEFVLYAVQRGAESAQEVWDAMVEAYGFGDFSGPEWGTIDAEGVYHSKYDEDPDLHPLVRYDLQGDRVSVYLYNYGIVSVVSTEQTIIGRMD